MSEHDEMLGNIMNHAKRVMDAQKAASTIIEDSEFLNTTGGYKRNIAILDVIPIKKTQRSTELKIIGIDVLTSKVVLLVDNHGLSKGVYIPGRNDPIKDTKPNDVISLLCDLDHTNDNLNVFVARGPAEFIGTTNIAKLENKYLRLAENVPSKYCGLSSTADELLCAARRYPGKKIIHRLKIHSKINLHKGKYQIKVNFKDDEIKTNFATLTSHAARNVTKEKCFFRGYALIESQMKDGVLLLYVISLLSNPMTEEKYNELVEKSQVKKQKLIMNVALENAIDRVASEEDDDPFGETPVFLPPTWSDDEIYNPFQEEYFYDEDGNEIIYEEDSYPEIDSYFNMDDEISSYGDFSYDGHNMHIVEDEDPLDIYDLVPNYIKDPSSIEITDEDYALAESLVAKGSINAPSKIPHYLYMEPTLSEFATDFTEVQTSNPVDIFPDDLF